MQRRVSTAALRPRRRKIFDFVNWITVSGNTRERPLVEGWRAAAV